LPASPRILDLGCGSGAQTVHLVQLTAGHIVAVDLHASNIANLRSRLEQIELVHRVEARVADMTQLEFETGSFDLVWSEGALYNVGLARALETCHGLLVPGGYLAFTDAVWRTDDPPAQVRAAFADYPGMGKVSDALALIKRSGLTSVGHFDLPDEAWWDDFYEPMERRIEQLRVVHADAPDALATLDELAQEPQMHRQHSAHYGYAFFVARRP
jgi:SAM-dependent methyltransferase